MKAYHKVIQERAIDRSHRRVASLIIFFAVGLSPLCSCNKFVEINLPPNQVETQTVFSNKETAISAVAGLYSQMVASNLTMTNGGMSVYPGLSADEIYSTSANQTYDAFATNQLAADNGTVANNFWDNAYRNIYQCNSILEGLQDSKKLSDPVRNELTGEAEFVRAFYYFYLVNLFGDVPLVTTTDYRSNALMPRTPTAVVYQKIIADLQDAEASLPASYVTAGRARPNKWTAVTLLAKAYLFTSDWKDAATCASQVIESGMYSLVEDPNDVFLANSNEAIWQLVRKSNNTAEATAFIPRNATVKPTFALTDELLGAFEDGDRRLTCWTDSNVVNQKTYYYPFKYKIRQSSDVTEYLVVFRLAELYLIRAEAEAELNDVSEARSDIDMIRSRAGLPHTAAATQDALLQAVMHERQIELFCEWGNRWLDLKRTGQIDAVMANEKPGWKHYMALYPIPFDELQINKSLTQSPGYE
jgi:hypothetical protein